MGTERREGKREEEMTIGGDEEQQRDKQNQEDRIESSA